LQALVDKEDVNENIVLKIPLTDIVTYIVAQIQGKHRK
jgi:hypothetical protein